LSVKTMTSAIARWPQNSIPPKGALKTAIHRLRQRFKEQLREEISHAVSNPADVGDEVVSAGGASSVRPVTFPPASVSTQ
jgi:hypothetical protein